MFIHGLAGNHRYFQPQVEHFAGAHRVLGMDLRGHGDSDGPVTEAAIAVFAADVAAACERLGLGKAVLVGQSMGGHVAAQAACDFPERVAGLVFLDSSLIFPPEQAGAIRALLEGLRGPGFREAIEAFARGLFSPADDPVRMEEIVSDFRALPQGVVAPTAAAVASWRAEEVLPACRVPALYIAARECPELAQVQALLPALELARAYGSGHFLQLEVPGQVNAMIARFLATKIALART